MKHEESELLPSLLVPFTLLKAIADSVLAEGGSEEELLSLLADPEKCRRVAMCILGKPKEENGRSHFYSAYVEYKQPRYLPEEEVFDEVDFYYNSKKFKPIDICKGISTEPREIEFELVHLNKDMSTEAVLSELDRQRLRPALYEELLGFAKRYPEEQRKYPIVALGSFCRHNLSLYSPCIYGNIWGRVLDAFAADRYYKWDPYCRFLVVRKRA